MYILKVLCQYLDYVDHVAVMFGVILFIITLSNHTLHIKLSRSLTLSTRPPKWKYAVSLNQSGLYVQITGKFFDQG